MCLDINKKIGFRIKDRRLELKLTQEEVGKKVGVTKSTIQRYENGLIKELKMPVIQAIANALDVNPDWIVLKSNDKININKKIDNIFSIKTKKVPLLGDIACGKPIFADENFDYYLDVNINSDIDFCLRCKGDSMINARILDGDIVFIHKQDAVENGEIAAVIIDNEATLKRVNYKPEKNMLILKAENPKYDDFVYIGEELETIKILGKAVAFQSNIK